MRKIFLTWVLCVALFVPLSAFAAALPAGIQARLWFSKDPFVAGETITVYALVYNSSDNVLNGIINLHDGDTVIEKKPFTVDANGGSRVVSFPVLVSSGTHTFYAVLTDVAMIGSDGATIGISPVLTAKTTASEKRTATKATTPVASSEQATSSLPELVSAAKVLATTSAQVVEETMNQISESAPVSVASKAIPFIGGVDAFRSNQAKSSLERMHVIENTLQVKISTTTATGTREMPTTWEYLSTGATNGELFKTPLRYVELFLLLVWNFLTAHVIVFYTLILLIFYKIVKAILGVFF